MGGHAMTTQFSYKRLRIHSAIGRNAEVLCKKLAGSFVCNYLEIDLLPLSQIRQPRVFHRADMDVYVKSAVNWLMKP
jgi:hypothetical protein